MDETNFKCICGNTTFHSNNAKKRINIINSCDKCGTGYSVDFKLIEWLNFYNPKPKPIVSTLIPCSACGKEISPNAESCPNCGQPTGIHVCPKCPTCQSTNIEKISLSSKVVGGAFFGLFSSNVRKTMHCKNCGYKW